MVRLKLMLGTYLTLRSHGLNSTMVRLKQSKLTGLLMRLSSLNSTMVRLKLGQEIELVPVPKRSQFHYGSIKTRRAGRGKRQKQSLNSTMVRLKLHEFKSWYVESQVSIPLWFD